MNSQWISSNRSKHSKLITGCLALLMIPAQPCFADAFTYLSPGQKESYGINYSENNSSDYSSYTPTSHHRMGQATGIGSSTMQTTSVGSESMPRVNYTPTSNPALPQTSSYIPSTSQFHSFSESMMQPIFNRPQTVHMGSLGTALGSDLNYAASPTLSPLGDDIKFWSPHSRRGGLMQNFITNPLDGL